MGSEPLSVSEKLSRFAANLRYEHIPPEIVQRAKMCIMDSFSNMLGVGQEERREVLKMAGHFPESKEATVYGLFRKASCSDAALMSGFMARVLDLDDGTVAARGHPGTVLIPAVFSAGEKYHRSGRDVVVALIVGYETYVRLGAAINPAHRNRGFDTTGTVGVCAAALATSRVLGLDAEKMVWALGISVSLAGGLYEFVSDGSMPKNFHPGFAARNGILAAQLAQAGVTGPRTAFEGKDGFFRALVGEANGRLAGKVTDGLGDSFAISEIYFKRHACMRRIHAAVDAAILISKEHSLDAHRIKKAVVHTSRFVSELKNPSPTSIVAAQASVPYCIAVALARKQASIPEFTPEVLKDSLIQALANRVEIQVDAEFEAGSSSRKKSPWAARVEVFSDAGEIHTQAVDYPIGDPENPISLAELEEKFLSMASNSMDRTRTQRLREKIDELETVKDMSEFYQDFMSV